MKKIVVGFLAVVLIALMVFFALKGNGKGPEFRTEKVTRGDIVATVTATGTVNAVTTVLVGTQVSGTIKEIYADFNSPVSKGQLIAQIDSAPFEAKVRQSRANLMQAAANVEKSEALLRDKKRIFDRNKELYGRGVVARSEFDTSETDYESAKAEVSVTKAQVAQGQAALNFDETNLKYTRIVSPVDGVVVSRNVDVGQTVAASFQTPTLFTIAEDLTKMQINTNVDEADIGKVALGQEAEFTVDAYPEITFRGSVSQVRIAPIVVENVVTYDVVVAVDNSTLTLKPGMTANVTIIVAKKLGVLRVPNAALRFRPLDAPPRSMGGNGVWTLEQGAPKRIKLATGISDGSFTEITSAELHEGQEVIIQSLTKSKKRPDNRGGPRFF